MKTLKPLLIALALSSTTFTTVQAAESNTTNHQASKQVAGYYHHQIGNTQITALLDGTNFLKPEQFKGLSPEQKDEILNKYYVDQSKGIQTSVNAFLIKTGDQLLMVDSGAASCFGAHLGSIYNNLKASGYQPEQVNGIFLTHLHPDHVCGISNNGVPNYPNATLHIAKTEYDYWLNPKTVNSLPKEKQAGFLGTVEKIKAALAPYEKAKKVKVFSDKSLAFGGITFKPSFGHTPGHYSFKLKADDQDVVFIGDIVHSHTLQFEKPETAIEFDIDQKSAIQTRLKHFAEYAKDGQLIAAPHLPFPGIGHIYSKDGSSYQWIPVHFKD
ncbi:MAG: MBL fold metallo-hydrolase [Candidatus Acinetobacter avistercoris]|uniref:MBL fold metallo-hydrolase n=1 Tax=Acinetobacter sp. KS-LM10 TaxID=3120518 RepID=UPI001FA3DA88|nr:MBL fold metallo-hydrolase [Candidatus Acinetobacter avistercoris]